MNENVCRKWPEGESGKWKCGVLGFLIEGDTVCSAVPKRYLTASDMHVNLIQKSVTCRSLTPLLVVV